MTCARDAIAEIAADFGWDHVPGKGGSMAKVDVYRAEPYSLMAEFTRAGMIISAILFKDAPDPRQELKPRPIGDAGKFDANKVRRIRSWMYDYSPQRHRAAL